MATCSLRFYKNSKLKVEKNWCFDNIETYLASLTYYDVSNYQYQRFELDKEIRVDFSQSEQTISPSANKYDYLRISTIVNNAPVYYYYFIIKTRQVSESTIAYQLRMDTLNTFKFSSTAANGNYTLSPKTLVKREHKDRFETSIDIISEENLTDDGYINVTPSTSFQYFLRLSNLRELIPSSEFYDLVAWHYTIKIYNQVNEPVTGELDCLGGITFTNVSLLTFRITYTDYSTNTSVTRDIPPSYKIVISLISHPNVGIAYSEFSRFVRELSPRINPRFVHCRIIDEYQEGLSTQLFKRSDTTLYDRDENNQWYVVYASTNAVVDQSKDTAATYVNPVQVRFYSDNGYLISTIAAQEIVLYPQSPTIPTWQNEEEIFNYRDSDTPPVLGTRYVKINGTIYDFHDYIGLHFERDYNTSVVFNNVYVVDRNNVRTTLSNTDSIIFYGINNITAVGGRMHPIVNIFIGSGVSSYSGTCKPWNEIDLTDPKLIKAFAFPYAPLEFLVGKDTYEAFPDGIIFSSGDNVIEVNNRNIKFSYQKQFSSNIMDNLVLDDSSINAGAAQPRNIKYESKLLHSDYYQAKFVYDSFSFTFNLENMDSGQYIYQFRDTSKLFVTYVVSANVQSKFMFQFDSYITKRAIQNYDNVLCIERNNEKALFNNAFINYIRSGGYTYDNKKASSQNAVNGVTTALSIVGSIASFASSAATGGAGIAAGVGLAIGAAAGIIRSVHTAQEQDRSIAQKLTQQFMEGTSVQGSEDIDILKAFSDNKAKIVEYKLSDIMQTAMWDLFHYCGYATHEQKIPDVTTRLYFNFVQAEVIFGEYNFNDEIADDIQNKWNEGVTFFHPVSGAYDINQEYENFETSLL